MLCHGDPARRTVFGWAQKHGGGGRARCCEVEDKRLADRRVEFWALHLGQPGEHEFDRGCHQVIGRSGYGERERTVGCEHVKAQVAHSER